MASKKDKADHMRWQVEKRSQNQACCVRLFELLNKHSRKCSGDVKCFLAAQDLIGAAFSLWRAVFLGNKGGDVEIVFSHAMKFFEGVILDNSISYVQDKNNNEWTFNYYASNARFRLIALHEDWPTVVPNGNQKSVPQ